MKISSAMQKKLNTHAKREFESAMLYLDMSNKLNSMDLPGFSHWMFVQYREELAHAEKIIKFVQSRDGDVELAPIEKISFNSTKPIEFFENAHEQEIKVTGFINELLKEAREEGDYATESFLKWFVDEQVQEEEQTISIVKKLRLVEGDKAGFYEIEQELLKREEEH